MQRRSGHTAVRASLWLETAVLCSLLAPLYCIFVVIRSLANPPALTLRAGALSRTQVSMHPGCVHGALARR